LVYLLLSSRADENNFIDPVFDCDDLQREKRGDKDTAADQQQPQIV
jgi:hypothetical protein